MLRRLVLAALILAFVGAGAVYWLWRQATALPEWHQEMPVPDSPALDGSSPDGAPPPLRWTAAPDADPPPGRKQAERPRQRELRNFHLHARDRNRVLQKAVASSRATYEDGTLEAGVVLVPENIELDALSRKDRALVERALKSFPGLSGRRVYLALEDEPKVVDGVLQLSNETQIRVGELRYPLSAFAKKIGVRPDVVRRQINRELRRLEVRPPDP